MFAGIGPIERIVVAWTAGTIDVKAAVTDAQGRTKKIRLLGGLVFAGASASTVKFQSHAGADTDLSGVITVAANGVLLQRIDEAGQLETVAGEGLRVVVTGAFNGVITLQYVG